MSSKAVVVLAVNLFLVGILICGSVTKSEAVPRSGTDREGMECETNPVLGADGTQTGLSVFSCCWHEYVTTASGRVDNGEWCQDCNLGYDGNVQSCGDEYPARKFSPPGGSVIGHLPTENAPPNNTTTGLSHGGIIRVPPGITNSLPTSNSNGNGTGSSITSHQASTHIESSSSTGQAGQSSNHHNKGGNQVQEGSSSKGSSSNGDTNSGNSNSNDKSKSNSKDNSGH